MIILFLLMPLRSGAQTMTEYTAYPPFIISAAVSNLLFIIDNSASMNDLQYVDDSADSTYCYDNTFDNTASYAGYFQEDIIYMWDSISEVFKEKADGLSASCDHQTSYLCVNVLAGAVTDFEASGKFFNWLTASKLDVLKWIMTGGKYIDDSGDLYLEGESRGCVGKRFVRTVPQADFTAGGNVTFGIRGTVDTPNDPLSMSFGGNTIIEIYEGLFDPAACQDAIDNVDNQGIFKQDVIDCLDLGGGGKNSFTGQVRAVFNQAVHACWQLNQGMALSSGTINASTNACKNIYDTILPGDIQPESAAYLCADRRKVCTNSDPIQVCDGLTGFLGQCWVDANGDADDWSDDGSDCEETQINNFCGYLEVPEVIDPTDSSSDTGEFLNLPSFLIDSGVLAQLGDPVGIFPVKIRIEAAPTGILHGFEDKIRMGLMRFNYCGSASENISNPNVKLVCNDPADPSATDMDGGTITNYIGEPGIIAAVNSIEATSWTPIAEAYYNAIAYYVKDAKENPDLDKKKYSPTADAIAEPLNGDDDFLGLKNPIQYDCQDNHILIISDGASTTDLNTVVTDKINDASDLFNDSDSSDPASCGKFSGSTYLDDLSYFAKKRNIFDPSRTGFVEPAQRIGTIVVYTGPETSAETGECDPKTLMEKTAMNGGTSMYNSRNPVDIARDIEEAMIGIASASASGTAVSVLSTTGEGEGAIYQAHFYPELLEKNGESRKWIGYLHSLFVDKYGNLREDTDSDDALDLVNDYILEMEYSVDAYKICTNTNPVQTCTQDSDCGNETCIASEKGALFKKYEDSGPDPDGVKDTLMEIVSIDDVSAVWKADDIMWKTDPVDRNIYTTTDESGNGSIAINFDTANSAALAPYLRAADNDGNAEAANIIKWMRGYDFTDSHTGPDFLPYVTDAGHPYGYRERSITSDDNTEVHVWKLGDIIYSTPSAIGRPVENYGLLYGDKSYRQYKKAYKDRRRVIYAGANDGMLHAFNGGYFSENQHKYCTGPLDANGDCKAGGAALGSELWAFIPRGLLPHLKWLTYPHYTHVYYVDQNPKITEVKIFDDTDNIHTNGWGTILIGGFRYGGKDISWTFGGTNYSASPEYFALDITDSNNAAGNPPKLLWTFSHPDLGLTMSYPAILKVQDKWYAVFGSGPTDYDSNSDLTAFQDGNIFVLDLTGGSHGVIATWTEDQNFWKIPTGHASSFLANPITVDVDQDYNVDVIYIGEPYMRPIKWSSVMHRITTDHGQETDPLAWVDSTLGDIAAISGPKDQSKRITSSPSASMDDRTNLWLYFGTGQFLGLSDRNTSDTGAFYAIKDGCWKGNCTTSYSDFVDISAATIKTDGTVSGVVGCSGGAATWNSLISAVDSCEGWVMYFEDVAESVDFMGNTIHHAGERVFSKPLVIGGIASWGTYIPGTSRCSHLGESNAYAVYYQTGTAYKEYIFEEQTEDENPSDEIARSKYLGVGMPSSPSAQVTEDGSIEIYFQLSTGTITPIKGGTPFSLQSNIVGWTCEEIQ
jgi:type IV pilus assembly protein PilY1